MAVRDTGTEQLIKDTAKRIFFREGKFHATTQDIADAAGVNRTLVHYYFRSRDILFEQVVKEAKDELHQTLDKTLAAKLSFKDKLKKMIDVFMDETMAFPYRELFVITENKRHDKQEIDLIHDTHVKPFLAEIKTEILAGNITTTNDPRQFMMSLFSLMAYPVLAESLNKTFLKISDTEFPKMMKQRRQIIFDMLYR
ncbi:transcriptional regulator, TetR family [Pedobacter westerhofensis]|uniref:Transcriptional regulator, TetR family n=1 Tax=Pedobacter westerhofensis TaxID=425512 RepID=A0A521CYX8_9SPHI|nr:TetR/AcrR family transcriptional regulator [Pedobacter westerhofensis]SMO64656.1 transcriptional regulator, TetR family [Pedobacter westerhofensis]